MGATASRPNSFSGSASEHPVGNVGAPGEPQYSVEQALALQRALLAAFAEESFQKLLKLQRQGIHTGVNAGTLMHRHLLFTSRACCFMSTRRSCRRHLGACLQA